MAEPLEISEAVLAGTTRKYLAAVLEAGRIYRRIETAKGPGKMVVEVSMDETDEPQSPTELLLILAALGDEGIPAQTIAPRFSGRFNKGVDYVGDPGRFDREFRQDLAVTAFAARQFGLPANLKLSVHSGSDKFTLYPLIRRALREFDAGVHLKTAGTTWLEELIGLAVSGGDGLAIAKEIYAAAVSRMPELCALYASVIDIDRGALAFARDREELGRRTFCGAGASRSGPRGLQSESAAIAARWLQGRCGNGQSLHGRPGEARRGDFRGRYRQPLPTPCLPVVLWLILTRPRVVFAKGLSHEESRFSP